MFGKLTKIAKTVTGATKGFRKVLDFNPSLASFAFPPQVAMGLKVANIASDALGLNLKVPTEGDLKAMAQGKIDKILGGIRRPVLSVLDKLEGGFTKKIGSAQEVLSKLDWLL